MEPTPAPKKRDYSGRVYKPRKCLDCPVIFTPRSSQQVRCPDCQYQRELRLKREDEKRRNDAKREPRFCLMCEAELPVYQGNHSLFCADCRPEYWKAFKRAGRQKYIDNGQNKQWQRKYRLANPEVVRESARRWRQAHPDEGLAQIHRRRMRIDAGKLDALDRLLSTEYRKAIAGDACYYCGSPDTQCVDHFFPLAKGGTDHFFNLVRACRADNLSKGTMCGTKYMLLLLSGG
jgi:DNA-directed RNA polymerase subunit RPC12/RpoP